MRLVVPCLVAALALGAAIPARPQRSDPDRPVKNVVGLRIVDVGAPFAPREFGYFIPQPAAGRAAPQTSDVDTDGRGLIYIVDRRGARKTFAAKFRNFF